jgi:CHAT domain-containing protein/tetratricopeptide (TPR) repeat protein
MNRILGCLSGLCLLWFVLSPAAPAQESKPPTLTPEERALAAEAAKLNAEGERLYQQGRAAEAVAQMRQALEIRRRIYPAAKYPGGHADMAGSLNNLGTVLWSTGSAEVALPFFEQALAMNRLLYPAAQYPDGHGELAQSLNNVGVALRSLGRNEKAVPFYEQALAMRRALYPAAKFPDGHPELVEGLGNMGTLLKAMGQDDKARPFYEQALAMNRRLYPAAKYPAGHPELARSLGNLGGVLLSLGMAEKAVPMFEESLAMRQRLFPAAKYPAGHPELARGLSNLAGALRRAGAVEKSLPMFEQALAMYRALYPPAKYPGGHPNLAIALNNMASALLSAGSADKALPFAQEVLSLRHALGQRLLLTAPEADALAYAETEPLSRDGYLSTTARLPGTEAAAYRAVWDSKAFVGRVLEHRHAAARVAGTAHAATLAELTAARRRVDQVLQDRRLPPDERDRLLAKAADDRDALERTLAAALPTLWRARDLDALGPDGLVAALPDHAALLDFVLYTRFDHDPARPGAAGDSRTPVYAAFVLAKGQAIRRIEMGEAKAIDQAVTRWRTAIEARAASPATIELHDRVWARLAPQLPAGTTTLYVSPDGDLARLPWAALPTAAGRVLLEDFAVAAVPHGPFLLEALKYPREDRGAGAPLLVGGIDYNSKTWPGLPGTLAEVTALAALAPTPATTLTKSEATAARLTEALSNARCAHVATHGYFDAETLSAEHRRAAGAAASRQPGEEARRDAAKNPLAFTGLVLANGAVLSGLSIVDLQLENLRLVTLSACETGLGEYTGGEGVQGLERAFHLAGCPNVVASLWKVHDAATAALMAKFYHELWVNKRDPLAALREAQLTIYHHPELIPDLAGERGAPKLKEAVAVKKPGEPGASATGGKHADTKLWAAFVLSGAGK